MNYPKGEYEGYTYTSREVTREWSEDAAEYVISKNGKVVKKDECEYPFILKCVQEDIDNLNKIVK